MIQIKKYITYSLLSFGLAFNAHSYNNQDLPDLGASALNILSIEKEKRLGDLIFNEMRGRGSFLNDPLINEYINSLGNRLVAHSQDVKFPFRFFTVNSDDINAFAFYGGHVGIHTGLIAAADTESQLASVLAHEIAHVTQRHLARRQQASSQQAPLTLAGFIGSIISAAVSPQAMLAGMMATQAGSTQAIINHTRGNEQEADNIGMNVLAIAGFDPYAASEFFGKLQQQSRYNRTNMPFLVTHPLPDSRVTDARLRAQQYEKRFFTDSLDFLLVKERIVARYINDKERNIESFRDKVKKSRGKKLFAAQYGLALALLDEGKTEEAESILLSLDEQAQDNLYIIDTLTDLYIAKKKPDNAIQILAKAYQLRPNNSVVTLNYANAAIENSQPKKAIQLLEYYLLAKPNDFLATQILRDAYKADDNKAKYHTTSAEFYALMSNYRAAIQSADKALAELTENDKAEINRLEALKIKYRDRQNYIKNFKGV